MSLLSVSSHLHDLSFVDIELNYSRSMLNGLVYKLKSRVDVSHIELVLTVEVVEP
jgi:hypothetical protein